jgi:hypothetical protein
MSFMRLRLMKRRRSLQEILDSTVRQSLTALCCGEATTASSLSLLERRDNCYKIVCETRGILSQ